MVRELTSLDEGGAKFRLDNVLIDSENLSFELKQTQAKFSGKLSEKKTTDGSVTAEGEWTQRGASLPLVFRRFDVMPEDLPTEVWVGDLSAGPQKLTMQFRVYLNSNGEERVFADSVSQRAGGFKATRRKSDQGEIIFEVPVLKGQFSGTPTEDGKLRGKWSQGVSLDLELRKVERPVEPQLSCVSDRRCLQSRFLIVLRTCSFRAVMRSDA